MDVKKSFSELKNETAQMILWLQDEAILAKVRAILWETPTPKADLEAIERSRVAIRAGRVTPVEDFLAEIEAL